MYHRSKQILLFFYSLCFPIIALASHTPQQIKEVLEKLDAAIARKVEYQTVKEKEISTLKQHLLQEKTDSLRSAYAYELSRIYLHFQADSALHYLHLHDKYKGEKTVASQITQAEIMSIMGIYGKAEEIFSTIAPPQDLEERRHYYRALRAHYGWIADYTYLDQAHYLTKMDMYRDSILHYAVDPLEKSISMADKLIMHGNPKAAIQELKKLSERSSISLQNRAYIYYTLQAAYEALGEREEQIYYLACTAILDLQMAVREYAALQKLAYLLYEEGDIKRAYSYLSCAMKDAIDCHTHLRTLEATKIFPIIDKAYAQEKEQKNLFEKRLLIAITVLALFFIVMAGYFYYWMKKLASMRRNLYYANKKLNSVNTDLEQTGKIKEVYIARYLEKCVSYIDKLEQYRRSLEKLAMASKVDELYKAIKSEQFLREERKYFYTEFDRSFIALFPHFIDDFNALLTEDAMIIPKSNEILNTELRIFALIRLGITDASQIAHFLGYSLATVYNYRSKIRNKAKGDKDNFEEQVMRL